MLFLQHSKPFCSGSIKRHLPWQVHLALAVGAVVVEGALGARAVSQCCCGGFCALMTLVFQDFSRFSPEARIAIVGESSEGPRQLVVDSSLGSGASRSRAASLAAGESVNEVKSSHIRLSCEGADCLCLRHACVLMLLSVNAAASEPVKLSR